MHVLKYRYLSIQVITDSSRGKKSCAYECLVGNNSMLSYRGDYGVVGQYQ
jgi:hypothetical protein